MDEVHCRNRFIAAHSILIGGPYRLAASPAQLVGIGRLVAAGQQSRPHRLRRKL